MNAIEYRQPRRIVAANAFLARYPSLRYCKGSSTVSSDSVEVDIYEGFRGIGRLSVTATIPGKVCYG